MVSQQLRRSIAIELARGLAIEMPSEFVGIPASTLASETGGGIVDIVTSKTGDRMPN